MSVTAPETIARQALKSLIDTEFSAEGFVAENDHLHESIGRQGTRIGTSPVRSRPRMRNMEVLDIELLVQFYGRWKDEISPETKVDPAKVENYAERFRRALRTGDPNHNAVWYFQLADLDYPPDPTGNKTRFEATVVAVGRNSALSETTG